MKKRLEFRSRLGILIKRYRWIDRNNGIMARLAGFEPAAYGLEVRCSIHLSYRRMSHSERK